MGNLRLAAIISMLAGVVYFLLSANIDLYFHKVIKQYVRKNNSYRKSFFNRFSKGSYFNIGTIIITLIIIGTMFITVLRLSSFQESRSFIQSNSEAFKRLEPFDMKFTAARLLSLLINVLLIVMFIFFKAESSLMKSLKGDYTSKMALLCNKMDPKEYTALEFRYGSISSLEDYVTYMNELDMLIKKHA